MDESELLKAMLRTVQDAVDVPICIDSSVIEALEAGLSVYEGRALVNSVTAEDERLRRSCRWWQHDAAVIGLANDETGIPETPQKRLECARKIIAVADDHGIAPEDVMIDPLAMTVGADTEAVTITLATISLIRDELGVNMCLGASNVSFGLPSATCSTPASSRWRCGRADQRDHVDRRGVRAVGARRRSAARPRRLGHELDRRPPRPPGRRGRRRGGGSRGVSASPPKRRPLEREPRRPPDDGAQRVRLRFLPDGGEVRVPSGTPIFDAASWNGIAIDSTCGGHGPARSARCGSSPATSRSPWTRGLSPPTSCATAGAWPAGRRARRLVVEVPPC